MPLLGIFCCNPDPDRDWSDDVKLMNPDIPNLVLCTIIIEPFFPLKWHYLGYFDVIRIQIRICEPDADFDQDGPRYTELTMLL